MPLKESEIREFKKILENIRQELTQSLKGAAAEVKSPDEATGYSQHQADQGTDDFGRTISLEVTANEYGVLRQIERALEKIEQGSYGICDITGEEIPLARLKAVPYALTTVKAQKMVEEGLLYSDGNK